MRKDDDMFGRVVIIALVGVGIYTTLRWIRTKSEGRIFVSRLRRYLQRVPIQFVPDSPDIIPAGYDKIEPKVARYFESSKTLPTDLLVKIGNVELALSNFQRANRYFEQAKKQETTSDSLYAGHILHCLGLVRHYVGEFEDALRLYRKAARQFGAIDDQIGQANVYECMALIQLQKEEFDQAEQSLNEVLRLSHHIEDKRHEINILRRLSDVHWARGDAAATLRYLKRALYLHDEFMIKEGRDVLVDDIREVEGTIE